MPPGRRRAAGTPPDHHHRRRGGSPSRHALVFRVTVLDCILHDSFRPLPPVHAARRFGLYHFVPLLPVGASPCAVLWFVLRLAGGWIPRICLPTATRHLGLRHASTRRLPVRAHTLPLPLLLPCDRHINATGTCHYTRTRTARTFSLHHPAPTTPFYYHIFVFYPFTI